MPPLEDDNTLADEHEAEARGLIADLDQAWEKAATDRKRLELLVEYKRRSLAESIKAKNKVLAAQAETTAEVKVLSGLVRNLELARKEDALRHAKNYKAMEDQVKAIRGSVDTMSTQFGQVAKELAQLGKGLQAEAVARERQDSVHDKEIDSARNKVVKVEQEQQTTLQQLRAQVTWVNTAKWFGLLIASIVGALAGKQLGP